MDGGGPDVRPIYDRMPLVVEVQLATTQIPIIVQREDFYESASIRLIWLTWNFEPPTSGRLLSSFEDIFYSHDKNLANTWARSTVMPCALWIVAA